VELEELAAGFGVELMSGVVAQIRARENISDGADAVRMRKRAVNDPPAWARPF
jgi:hypothetical protein